MTEPVVMDLKRASRRGVLAVLALATLLGAGGCSSVPDALNPVEWYRGTRDWIAGDDKVESAKQAEAEARPVPGSDKPFPSLTSVPERPAATTRAERRQMARSLAADRDAARYTDEQIRRQTADAIAAPSSPARSAPAAAAEPNPAPSRSTASSAASRPSSRRAVPPPAPGRPMSKPPAPVEMERVKPSAGQVAALPRNTQEEMPSAPPAPPEISSVVASGQPIPVRPLPPQPAYRMPPAPPPAVQTAPAEQRTTFVRPGAFSPRFGPATGPVRPPGTVSPPQPAASQFTRTPSPGAAPPPLLGIGSGGTPVATVYFGVGSSKIGPRGRKAIRRAFRQYQSRGGRIRVVGHASSRTRNMDRVSHELANFKVSDERARAVARELIRLGVDPSAIIVEAVADHQPAFIEVMPAGEAGNRRAEILLEN